jgi:NAD(P)-dependent dehydrogenase (short-subunit alcohol dehydrogenase family)
MSSAAQPAAGERVVLITGGAKGLGRELSLAFAHDGWRVAVCDIDAPAAAQLREDLKAAATPSYVSGADVTQEAELEQLVAEVTKLLGPIDGLVNSAFHVTRGSVLDLEESQWFRAIDTNLTGYFLPTLVVAKDMAARGAGSIVNLSSGTGELGFPGTVSYATAKGGVNAITRSFAAELATRGVRVNTVVIGPLFGMERIGTDAQGADARRRRIPMQRRGQAHECVGAVRHLLSDEASWTTGAMLHVDGGANHAAFVQQIERYRSHDWD